MDENLMIDYLKNVYKIREHIKLKLEEKYNNIIFTDEYNYYLLAFTINNWYFEVDLHNSFIRICSTNNNVFHFCDESDVETIEEFFNYIESMLNQNEENL